MVRPCIRRRRARKPIICRRREHSAARVHDMRQKSEEISAGLNFLFPGAGFAYLGQWGWAVLNFIVFVILVMAGKSIGYPLWALFLTLVFGSSFAVQATRKHNLRLAVPVSAADFGVAPPPPPARRTSAEAQPPPPPPPSRPSTGAQPPPPPQPASSVVDTPADVGAAAPTHRFCSQCGARAEGARFCPQCGASLVAKT